jgi:hypothetical protein
MSCETFRARACAESRTMRRIYFDRGGIRVRPRWNDFHAFVADMGRRRSVEITLDRIDGNGNYEPGNCRWATWAMQGRNSLAVKLNPPKVQEIRRRMRALPASCLRADARRTETREAGAGADREEVASTFGAAPITIGDIGNTWRVKPPKIEPSFASAVE